MAYERFDTRALDQRTSTYKAQFWSVANDEQKAAADKVWTSAVEQVKGLLIEGREIVASVDYTEEGRKKKLAAWATKAEALKRDLLPFLKKESEKPAQEIANLIAAADGGLVWDEKLKGYTRKTPISTDPQAIADATEARAYWRTLPPQQFLDDYRQWVMEDDPRARIAEADPTGVLVSGTASANGRDRSAWTDHRMPVKSWS